MLKPRKTGLSFAISLNLAIFCLVLPSLSQPKGATFLVEMRGDVQLKKARASQFRRAKVGELLAFDDQLRLGRNASATVLCSSEKQWQVPAGRTSRVSEGCPPGTQNSPERPTRG